MKPSKEELVKRYINLVYYYANRWMNKSEDIDDIVQETYKKVFMKYDTFSYQNENQLKAWLLTICRNCMMDEFKLKKTTTLDEVVEGLIIDTNTEDFLQREIKKEEVSLLKVAMKGLAPEQYEILRLRYFDEVSFKDIAGVLQINEATAKMRCYRALEKLRKDLSHES
jgi:RNA polymerase sigma factor (sigma-70 family)